MVAPDKTQLAAVRILDILALAYPLLSSPGLRALAGRRLIRPLEACRRHADAAKPVDRRQRVLSIVGGIALRRSLLSRE
jgi:hypothetical protein